MSIFKCKRRTHKTVQPVKDYATLARDEAMQKLLDTDAQWDASVAPRVAGKDDGDARSVSKLATVTVRQRGSKPGDLTISYGGLHHVDHVGLRCVVDASADVLTVVVEIPHAPESTEEVTR